MRVALSNLVQYKLITLKESVNSMKNKKLDLEQVMEDWGKDLRMRNEFFNYVLYDGGYIPNGQEDLLYKVFSPDTYKKFIAPQLGKMKMDPGIVLQNPYINLIELTNIKKGDWKIDVFLREPFQLQLVDAKRDGLKIKPRLGYFDIPVPYYRLTRNGIPWMSISASEMLTMRDAVAGVSGHVLVAGIGLGYFPFITSLKESVKKITLVEIDENIIEIFETKILPQFPRKEKIEIVHADAIQYFQEHHQQFDSHFIDIWQGSDFESVKLYMQFKAVELREGTKNVYHWIEDSLRDFISNQFMNFIRYRYLKLDNYYSKPYFFKDEDMEKTFETMGIDSPTSQKAVRQLIAHPDQVIDAYILATV
ncbi:hypothetical protein GCM10023228_17840 [Brevibacillus fulvus]